MTETLFFLLIAFGAFMGTVGAAALLISYLIKHLPDPNDEP